MRILIVLNESLLKMEVNEIKSISFTMAESSILEISFSAFTVFDAAFLAHKAISSYQVWDASRSVVQYVLYEY